jgi:nicotinate-nucleotide pyrophosphorylase (carboxylating)
LALAEDVGAGDATSLATIEETTAAVAEMVTREPLVVAGLPLSAAVFREVSANIEASLLCHDGQSVAAGQVLMRLTGPARALLTGERVALNFVQRLSGIATLTAQFVRAVAGASAKILDTRKTTPGWRRLEKYAVVCGGGQNHRMGLFDMVLIKDNHLAALQREQPNAISAAVRRARARYPSLPLEVEVTTLAQAQQAAEAGADIILLDNMNAEQMRQAVRLINRRARTEASGGVTLATVGEIARSGVDFISVGALTHSARAVDISLELRSH